MQIDERCEAVRKVLLRHAYRMLGEYGDAEDVVQDERNPDKLQRLTPDRSEPAPRHTDEAQ